MSSKQTLQKTIHCRSDIQSQNSNEFNVELLTKRYAMDCIGRIVYSMDFDAIKNPTDNVVSISVKIVWQLSK